ncbi:TldD/PmbA family protein [Methanopyrus kandleri]|uniref:TldD/PmbA family protein n=1 Tax=Methanopyrus kandleri TaxID=2320 RepID=A0A832T1A9_9EURY|nr:TldD/PmbA family protein [Methanopyrus kandleri]HII69810.1 TldD/PmbA family protein [Methanopyrus kandleri]
MDDPLSQFEPGRAVLLEVETERVEVERTHDTGDRGRVSADRTIVVRVSTDGGLGVATVADPGEVDTAVERALASAEMGTSEPVEYPDSVDPARVSSCDPSAVDEDELWDLLEAVVNEVSDDVTITSVSVTGVRRRVIFRTPSDQAEREESSVTVSLDVIGEFSGFAWDTAVGPRDIDPELLAREASEMASEAPKERVSGGELAVAFHPRAFSELLTYVLIPALSGLEVLKGTSGFDRGDIGRKVGPESLRVVNDPTLDRRPGSYAFDDEGSTPKRMELISDGILRSFYTDLYSSRRLGMESTGSGLGIRRPEPSPANVIVQGDASEEEVLEEADLIVYRTLGAHTASKVSGRFSVTALWAETVEGRAVPVSVRGNLYSSLRDALISEETERTGVVEPPYALLRCRVG